MITARSVDRLMELLPEETRLVRQVKSGDVTAFVKLYDVYVERIHRYIYLQIKSDRAVEGITFQTFFTAWKHLNEYRETGLPFISWLYSIAQNQINTYYRTHKNPDADVQEFLISKSRDFDRDIENIRDVLQFFTAEERQALILKYIVCMPVKGISRLITMQEGAIRDLQFHALQALAGRLEEKEIKIKNGKFQRILSECQVKTLNETSTVEEQLARYPEYADQLGPLLRTALSLSSAREINPLATFTAYTREALLHYMVSNPRRPQRAMNKAVSWRVSSAFAALIMALLVTGTAQAQSAMPGEPLYGWKRASEVVWRAISLDPVSADIFLAERRIDEWIEVADNPEYSASAADGYVEAISRLEGASAGEVIRRIVPALQSQQATLNEAGLESNALANYLSSAAIVPTVTFVQPQPTSTRIPPTETKIPPTATRVPPTATEFIPTATEIPPTATQVPPTATATEAPSTATEIPSTATEIPPTATEIPPIDTEIPPTETEVPTETSSSVEPTVIPISTPTAMIAAPQ